MKALTEHRYVPSGATKETGGATNGISREQRKTVAARADLCDTGGEEENSFFSCEGGCY